MPVTTPPAALPGTAAIRLGIALLATIGFALSYDALRQMALAVHIRGALTYAFPLVIDGFIAIGVGALLLLRTAPLRSRLYVWTLVGLATLTSIWANALHAVRLNQQTRPDGLHLDDFTVGALSAIAPLALAGAVHLYIVIGRHPTLQPPLEEDTTDPRPTTSTHHTHSELPQRPAAHSRAAVPEVDVPVPEHTRLHDAPSDSDARPAVHPDPTGPYGTPAHPAPESHEAVPAQATPSPRRTGRPPNASLDELLAIARPVVERLGEIDRDAITEEIRNVQGRKASNQRLQKIFKALEQEQDSARPSPRPSG